MTGWALWPKRAIGFVLAEYVAPLSNGERMLVVATFLASLVSASGVQAHLRGAYGPLIGWVGAIAIELVYLGGALAGSAARHRRHSQIVGIWLALGNAALLAIIFNLAHQEDARGALSWYAVVEAIGFPLIALICAMVSHTLAGERLAEEAQQRELEAQARRREAVEQQQLQQEYRRRRMELELRRQEAEHEARLAAEQAEQAEKLRALRRQLRQNPSLDTVNGTVHNGVNGTVNGDTLLTVATASGSAETVDRDTIKAALLDTWRRTNGQINKQAFARLHRISRQQVYNLLKELRQDGALEDKS
jgi:hypothetical protein